MIDLITVTNDDFAEREMDFLFRVAVLCNLPPFRGKLSPDQRTAMSFYYGENPNFTCHRRCKTICVGLDFLRCATIAQDKDDK
jgi:hypothetical protein